MRLAETRDLFASRFDFPTDRSTVVEQMGATTIESPTGEDETIEAILTRVDQDEYGSADELYDLLITYVSDQYIGRKFYDDRGSMPVADLDEVSF